MKYMGERDVRRIAVRAVDTGDAIRIEVSDTGPGIPEDALPHLFEAYFRIAGKSHAGLGLGLPTVKKLVEGHGGRVGVKSQVGKGTTFWVELPYARALAEPSIPATAAAVC
jgi:signal transduction histidine kinase